MTALRRLWQHLPVLGLVILACLPVYAVVVAVCQLLNKDCYYYYFYYKNDGLDQYGDEPFGQQLFETAGVDGVNDCSRNVK